MKHYKYLVVETYPDGFKWNHYYKDREGAEWGVEDLTEAHPGRTYEIKEL